MDWLLAVNGGIAVSNLVVDQGGDSTFAGRIEVFDDDDSQIGDYGEAIVFEKLGEGALALTNADNTFYKQAWSSAFTPSPNFDSFLQLTDGVLVLGEVGALGDAEDVIVFNGGTLRYTSASVSDRYLRPNG